VDPDPGPPFGYLLDILQAQAFSFKKNILHAISIPFLERWRPLSGQAGGVLPAVLILPEEKKEKQETKPIALLTGGRILRYFLKREAEAGFIALPPKGRENEGTENAQNHRPERDH
jgi:hypothetical protein